MDESTNALLDQFAADIDIALTREKKLVQALEAQLMEAEKRLVLLSEAAQQVGTLMRAYDLIVPNQLARHLSCGPRVPECVTLPIEADIPELVQTVPITATTRTTSSTPRPSRRKHGSVKAAVEKAIEQLPERFSSLDVYRAVEAKDYVHRSAIRQCLSCLARQGRLVVEREGRLKEPNLYRKVML